MALDLQFNKDEEARFNDAFSQFTNNELARLKSNLNTLMSNKSVADKDVALSNQSKQLLENFSVERWVQKWSSFVDEIKQGYNLGIYDYVNDLSPRDLLQRLADVLPEDINKKITLAVKPIDDEYSSLTQSTELALAGPEEGNSKLAWWYHRIPKALDGELKEDIDSLANGHR